LSVEGNIKIVQFLKVVCIKPLNLLCLITTYEAPNTVVKASWQANFTVDYVNAWWWRSILLVTQVAQVRLYGFQQVGLWYLQCFGRLVGAGKGLGIRCQIASPEIILPGSNRTLVGTPVDCIVIKPGTVTVDNHGWVSTALLQ